MLKQNKKAFTLAEILITLAIMGTLMALTIPSLIKETGKNAYVAGLKKTYGMLDSATNQIMTDNAGTMIRFGDSTQIRLTKYCNILECNKTCYQGHIVDQGCFHSQSSVKMLNNQNYDVDTTDYNDGAMVLADGTLVYINWTGYSTCNFTDGGVTYCTNIYVDVNGFKGPNIVGKDIFEFWITANGLVPYGQTGTYADDTIYCNPNSTNAKDGYGCAAKVLNKQAMDY